jgi:surface carbohydrate biosynthesis protein
MLDFEFAEFLFRKKNRSHPNMIISGNNILLFPIETTVRELDFRLALAILCARPGWQIILGEHEELFKLTLRLENAVGVFKNVTGGKRPWKYQRYKDLNIRVIFLDEEGAIYNEGPERWKKALAKRIDVTELEAEDHVCTWGQFQADYYKSLNPVCAANIVATGHPRFNLCASRFNAVYQEEADALRREHGRFILLNTNFVANNCGGPDINLRVNKVDPEDVEKRSYYIGQYCYDNQRFSHFLEMVNHLSNAFPDRRIVCRPHPSENSGIYETMFSHIPRVVVTRQGSLNAWLHACQALVHDGCTTAVEGSLSGTPVINFHPIQDDRYDISIPNLAGFFCRTPEEVATAIRNLDAGIPLPALPPENSRQLTEMILNFDPSVDSFEELASIIGRCLDEPRQTKVRGPLPLALWHRLTDPVRQFARPYRMLNRLLSRKYRGNEKFPPFDRKLIREKTATFEKILGKKVILTFQTSKVMSVTTP